MPIHQLCSEEKGNRILLVMWRKQDLSEMEKHRELGKLHDSFVCYQKLEDNISFIKKHGIAEFEKQQKTRERLLSDMLKEFNEGRSKTHYCIAATVLEIEDLKKSLADARKQANGLEPKEKAQILHAMLDRTADRSKYRLKLRK